MGNAVEKHIEKSVDIQLIFEPQVVRGEGDDLGEGGCQVDGHKDHRVEARDTAAEARPKDRCIGLILRMAHRKQICSIKQNQIQLKSS